MIQWHCRLPAELPGKELKMGSYLTGKNITELVQLIFIFHQIFLL